MSRIIFIAFLCTLSLAYASETMMSDLSDEFLDQFRAASKDISKVMAQPKTYGMAGFVKLLNSAWNAIKNVFNVVKTFCLRLVGYGEPLPGWVHDVAGLVMGKVGDAIQTKMEKSQDGSLVKAVLGVSKKTTDRLGDMIANAKAQELLMLRMRRFKREVIKLGPNKNMPVHTPKEWDSAAFEKVMKEMNDLLNKMQDKKQEQSMVEQETKFIRVGKHMVECPAGVSPEMLQKVIEDMAAVLEKKAQKVNQEMLEKEEQGWMSSAIDKLKDMLKISSDEAPEAEEEEGGVDKETKKAMNKVLDEIRQKIKDGEIAEVHAF